MQVERSHAQLPQPKGGNAFRVRGRGGGFGWRIDQATCYNCGQPRHYAMDCINHTLTCLYCKALDHTIEECP